jgi:hypothetical protein
MKSSITFLIVILCLFTILTLPIWAGSLIRIFCPKMKKMDLAGLVSLPFLFYFSISHSDSYQSGMTAFLKGAGFPPPGDGFFFYIFAMGIPLFQILIFFAIFRAMAGVGITLTDKIRKRKQRRWLVIKATE